jgi:hypothetical protein
MCSPYHSFQMIKSLHFSLLYLILCTNNKFIEDSFIYLFFSSREIHICYQQSPCYQLNLIDRALSSDIRYQAATSYFFGSEQPHI